MDSGQADGYNATGKGGGGEITYKSFGINSPRIDVERGERWGEGERVIYYIMLQDLRILEVGKIKKDEFKCARNTLSETWPPYHIAWLAG